MLKVYLDNNYPKNLVYALQAVHQLQYPKKLEIIRTTLFNEQESVVFIFDKSKKGIDIVTEKHYDAGYRVFAFKFYPDERLDLFKFSLSMLQLWPKIIEVIEENASPFVVTYRYFGAGLKRVR
ncbi:MAG: hypothetical protein NVSMB24_38670 [Mucilaginibacter sp.]